MKSLTLDTSDPKLMDLIAVLLDRNPDLECSVRVTTTTGAENLTETAQGSGRYYYPKLDICRDL